MKTVDARNIFNVIATEKRYFDLLINFSQIFKYNEWILKKLPVVRNMAHFMIQSIR